MKLSKTEKTPKIVLEEKQLKPNSASLKHISLMALLTFVFTFFLGATFHLTIVAIFAVIRHDPSLINPIEFLGLTTIAPGLEKSTTALFIGWLVLVVLYWIVYRVLTGFEKITAFWYSTETYNKLSNQNEHVRKSFARLIDTKQGKYTVKQIRSFMYIIKSSDKLK